jgi:VanZ family protein
MKWLNLSLIVVFFVITYYSLRFPADETLPTNDKLGHFLAYAALTLNGLLRWNNKRKQGIWIGVAVFYGLLMEFGQGFVPGRDPSLNDMLANSCGVFIGFVIFWSIGRFIKQMLVKINVISQEEC